METETPAACALRLITESPCATLATRFGPEGWPYASLVLSAADADGSPILLLSALAQHTKNLEQDARLSLLFAARANSANQMAEARVTVLGRAIKSESHEGQDRFLKRHPKAKAYASFGDFAFYRVEIARAHLVQGFGRISWIEGADLTEAKNETA